VRTGYCYLGRTAKPHFTESAASGNPANEDLVNARQIGRVRNGGVADWETPP